MLAATILDMSQSDTDATSAPKSQTGQQDTNMVVWMSPNDYVSLFVTKEGAIGLNFRGRVTVNTPQVWHEIAWEQQSRLADRNARIEEAAQLMDNNGEEGWAYNIRALKHGAPQDDGFHGRAAESTAGVRPARASSDTDAMRAEEANKQAERANPQDWK